jgi:hypothetical protein
MVDNPNIQVNVNFDAIDNGLFRYNKSIDLPFDIKVSGPVEQFGGPAPEAEIAVVDVEVQAGGGTPTSIGGSTLGAKRFTIPKKDFNTFRTFEVPLKFRQGISKTPTQARKESRRSSTFVSPQPPERKTNVQASIRVDFKSASNVDVQSTDLDRITRVVPISQTGAGSNEDEDVSNSEEEISIRDDPNTISSTLDEAQKQELSDAYTSAIPFKIVVDFLDPREEQDNLLSQGEIIEFKLENDTGINNPTISIDGGARYSTKKILGGFTVRQKVGEKPLNISIDGVCFAPTAAKIDALREVDLATIHSGRFLNETATVFFTDTSTEPMTDGGAADLKTGNLLYSYSLKAVEARAP